MTTFEVIQARTSYRGFYHDTPVPREDLIKILQAGLDAPSGCNTQTTSLIAVDDPTLLQRLYTLIDVPSFRSAPAIICVLTQKIYPYRDKCFHVQDYSAAIQNMLLAIVELGYESCWVEGHITDDDHIGRQMAAMLNVPKEYDLVCFLPVGLAKDVPIKVAKKPFVQRAWFNGLYTS